MCSGISRGRRIVQTAIGGRSRSPSSRRPRRSRFSWIEGFDDPATPTSDRVGVLKEGSPTARKILILVPGTSASAAYFAPLAQRHRQQDTRAGRCGRWSAGRTTRGPLDGRPREARRGHAAAALRLLPRLASRTPASRSTTSAFPYGVLFARAAGACESRSRTSGGWSRGARRQSREVVLGGHSLGGSIATAYATWDFNGRPGGDDLSGLVSSTAAAGHHAHREQATEAPAGPAEQLAMATFGGIPPPFAGLSTSSGRRSRRSAPNEPSILQGCRAAAHLSASVAVTNEAGYGYALDTDTSPTNWPPPMCTPVASRTAALRAAGTRPGDISPIQRVADMFSGTACRPRRHRVVPPAAPDGRFGSSRRGDRQSGADGARRLRDARPGPRRLSVYAFGAPWEVRGCWMRRSAGRPVRHPAAEGDAGERQRHLRPRRSDRGVSAERLRGQPAAVPAEDQEGRAGQGRPQAPRTGRIAQAPARTSASSASHRPHRTAGTRAGR